MAAPDPATGRRPGGRTARVSAAVRSSALRLLLEQGYDQMTISAVAAAAGVAESTVYRRWGSRPELAADALISFAAARVPPPDTGGLRGDVLAWLGEVAATLSRPEVTRLLRAAAALEGDQAGVRAARARFYTARFDSFGLIIARAVARGELRPAADTRQLAELLVGPIYLRLLLTGDPVDTALVTATVDRLLPAFT